MGVGGFAGCCGPDHGEHEDDVEVTAETPQGLVEQPAGGRVGPAHHLLHAVGRADEMALVDAGLPAAADEEVLGMVGHAGDFVRHHLADRKNEVVTAFPDQLVELGRPGLFTYARAHMAHEFRFEGAHRHHVVTPVVHAKQVFRYTRIHLTDLLRSHGHMGAQGWQDIRERRSEMVIRHACDGTGPTVEAGEVWRYGEHLAAGADGAVGLDQGSTQIVFGDDGGG